MSIGSKVIVGVLIASALIAFIQISLPHWKLNASQAAAVALTSATSTVATTNVPKSVIHVKQAVKTAFSDPDGYATISGSVVMDNADKHNPVPYVAYKDQNGFYTTKQLIFTGVRGCSSVTGDLPCVGRAVTDAYPQLSAGEHIVVTGKFEDTRFLVSTISST